MLTVARYQRAFIDFFEDQLVATQYNLDELLDEFLFGGKEPLINGLISGRKQWSCSQQSIANPSSCPSVNPPGLRIRARV
jgi:hypothetical protein